jgi:2-dehydropantoate 2-reductase
MGAYRTSTQLDRQSGRPLEIEAMFGEPVREAERLGVQTPSMRWIYTLLKLQGRAGGRK